MVILLAWLTVGSFGPVPAAQTPDTMALAVALAHARDVITEGDILVSAVGVELGPIEIVPGSWIPEYEVLERAARIAGFSYGRDSDAVKCVPESIACLAQGTFRGLVHVAGISLPSADSITVTLRILHFTPMPETNYTRDDIYEQGDEVHVARRTSTSAWRIVRVRRIYES